MYLNALIMNPDENKPRKGESGWSGFNSHRLHQFIKSE